MTDLRIRGKFIDGAGVRKLDDIIPSNVEGEEKINCIYVESFKEMLLDALTKGEDVTIIVKRNTNTAKTYIS